MSADNGCLDDDDDDDDDAVGDGQIYNSNGIEYLLKDDQGWNMDQTGLDAK